MSRNMPGSTGSLTIKSIMNAHIRVDLLNNHSRWCTACIIQIAAQPLSHTELLLKQPNEDKKRSKQPQRLPASVQHTHKGCQHQCSTRTKAASISAAHAKGCQHQCSTRTKAASISAAHAQRLPASVQHQTCWNSCYCQPPHFQAQLKTILNSHCELHSRRPTWQPKLPTRRESSHPSTTNAAKSSSAATGFS
jgi:hypothetical protein